MRKGKDFEVPKEVYDRAKAAYAGSKPQTSYYMTAGDRVQLFDVAILCGYGLYDCKVREENGKYICSYMTGDSCD